MAARRALIREADLRRWARIARDEGVAIRGSIAPDGTVQVLVEPGRVRDDGNSFDQMMGGARG
ncbi:hypothetical protein SAMN02927924_00236 [Sphingobium faniae]|nr:hypothetical protein SAMN02927924_00236 [Sphingobium faniae]